MRKWIVAIVGVAVLAGINIVIYQREQLLVNGRVMLLELAPVDPRSLMQGDYMALRFKVVTDAFRTDQHKDGHLVVGVDTNGVATFRRFADGGGLTSGEALLRYRVRNGQPKFATNAFFFQEGHAQYYEKARYGEFRVAPNGEAILTAMRGADLKVLSPPVAP